MNEYEFVLKFKLPDANSDPADYLEALGEAGCDDALVGTGHAGHISLAFTREAEEAEDAVFSAISDVSDAIEGVLLLEASPDIVGLTDAAELLEVSRQYMRQLKDKNAESFPAPLHTGTSSLYFYADILDFLAVTKRRNIEEAVVDIARLNRRLNLCRQITILMPQEGETEECAELEIPAEVREILKSTPRLASG